MFYEFKHFGNKDYTKKYFGENNCFDRHLHQSFEFIAALSGEVEITVDKNTYALRPGDCVLIFPNQVHSVSSVISTDLIYIFSTEIVSYFSSKTRGKIPECNLFHPDKALIDTLAAFPERASLMEKKAVFYRLCAEFDKGAVYTERAPDEKNLLYDIFRFVEENFDKECTLSALCEKNHFSYSYLSRYFKSTTGVSFNEYVNQYRINNACYLLENTEASILSCSLESGYSSLRSFNRNFLRYRGMSPEQYRKRG